MSQDNLRLRALALSVSVVTLAAVAAPASAQDSSTEVEELVVTAEKREQRLQDVAAAVSAYTSDKRDIVGMTTIQDYVNWTPGMNYSGTDRVSLRGAGRNTFYTGNDPGVAAYTDGFYSASSSELHKTPLFVERTEILRGPQGTLYGRNSMGGALNVISKRPSREFSGELRGVLGNYDRYRTEGVVSLPLAETLRIKLGGMKEKQSEGFIKNIGGANEAGTINRNYFEAQVEAELGERTTAWVRYSRTSWDDTTGIGDRVANIVTPYETTRSVSPLGGLNTNPAFGYTVPNPGATDPYVMNTNTNGYAQLRGNHLLTAHVTFDLGVADLKWIGGYQRYEYQTGGDLDGTSRTAPMVLNGVAVFPDLTNDFREKRRYYSNEINLTSKGGGPLSWILGLYQYHEESQQRIQFTSARQPQLASPFRLAPTPVPAAANPSRNFVDEYATLEGDAYAVFGQATYAFTPAWSVTAGLRYTYDEKDGFESERLIAFAPTGPLAALGLGGIALDVSSDMDPATPGVQNFRRLSNNWSAVSGTLRTEWRPDADTLVYLKYDRGYKSGGFLLGSMASLPEAKKETVDAYEVGLKKTLMGRLTLNGSVFYNDYHDLQLNLSQRNAAGNAANNFINVDAEAYGLELEGVWQATDQLQFNAGYGYLHTEITRGCCFYDPADPSALLPGAQPSGPTAFSGSGPNRVLLVFQDLKGSQLYQSPKHKFAANGNYTFEFAPGSLILSATYSWTDSTIYQPFDNPAFRVPSYGTADFRAIWRDAGNTYSLIGFVKNAFDEEGFNSTGTTNPTAQFAVPNPGMACTAGGVTTTCLRQTSVGVTRGLIAPRTYGVELQYRF